MSLASGVIPASSFIYGCLYNDIGFHAKTSFQKNFGFFYKNNFLRPSRVRFVTNQKLRILKSRQVHGLCKWRDGFDHVAASFRAASSFNDSVGDIKDCGRVEGTKEEATNVDGSDTCAGYGHGNGDSRGNHRGGGDNGGLGESADWEGLRWFCWQIYKAWKYYKNLAKLSSSVVALSGVGYFQVDIEGYLKRMVEPNFDGLLLVMEPLLQVLCGLLLLPWLIEVAFCATLFGGILLFGCVVAAVIWSWRS